MNIAVVAQSDPSLLAVPYNLAVSLNNSGARVHFLSAFAPVGTRTSEVSWLQIPKARGLLANRPWFRSSSDWVFGQLHALRPDWIVAQHEFVVPALLYRATLGRNAGVAAYFADHHDGRKYMRLIKRLAHLLDVYVDVCDIRLGWRREEWPSMRADTFIVRNSTRRQDYEFVPHQGPPRVIFASSWYTLGLNRDRLSRFITSVCERGVSVDWYLPGPEEGRATARTLSAHPLFSVREPVDKERLLALQRGYDVGLHWAPMAEKAHDPAYFMTAASNKIGEYAASGLVIAHAGNPGLAYLPADICAVFDPTDPLSGADQFVASIGDREVVERKRRAALRFHQDEFNLEAQAAPLVRHLIENRPRRG